MVSSTRARSSATRVVLIGPAGAGKTTALGVAVEVLRGIGWSGDIISIEECQREVCPRGREDGTYFYDSDGALVLLKREEQAAAARERFVERLGAALHRGFVAELGQPQASGFLIERLSPVLDGVLVLHVTAPLSVRKQRNECRTDLRMPDAVLTWIEEQLTPDSVDRLKKLGAIVRNVDSNVPLQAFLEDVRTLTKGIA